jgi:hypothetical protein
MSEEEWKYGREGGRIKGAKEKEKEVKVGVKGQ